MDKEKLLRVIESFKDKKILVVGDIMLDKYIWGEVSRISPEAPVQVVSVLRETYAPGGAANVANNIAATNSKVFMVGIVGEDIAKSNLISELKKRNVNVDGIFTDTNRPTVQKVRVIGRSQHLLRFDYEEKDYVSLDKQKDILDFIMEKINEVDAVVVSDYAKGVITKDLMEKIMKAAEEKNKMVTIGPKPKHKDFYKNATLVAPNHTESHQMTRLEGEKNIDDDVEKIGKKLVAELNSNVLITRGEKGMSLFEKNGEITHIPTYAREVYDIVGAGDTSVAFLALALASGANFKEAAIIANHAAGITVGKVGTSTVSVEELVGSIKRE